VHAQSVEVFALLTIPPIEIVCAELAARLDQILMGNDVPGLFCADADHEVVDATTYVGERPEWREQLAERAKVIPPDCDPTVLFRAPVQYVVVESGHVGLRATNARFRA
jgi:hypothetical protein